MRKYCYLGRGAGSFAPLLLPLVLLIALFLLPGVVCAEGGVAITGSFSGQVFELAQGSSVNVSSVYVDVYNFDSESMDVRMTVDAPVGVDVELSETEFTLSPGGKQRVTVGITATDDIAPGEYRVDITAEPYRYNAGGIQVVGASGVSATLRVVGEGGTVTVNLLGADSSPIVGEVRLFRIISDKDYEIARSMTGTLSAAVAPGSFYAVAYAGESEIARESFSVAANEDKVVNLVGLTIYFAGFDPVPAYSNDTGLLNHVKIVYTLQNLYQPMSGVEVFLVVLRGGTQLERFSILSISTLEIGSLGTSYNYISPDGWVNGDYSFQLQLYVGNEFFTNTLAKSLVVGDTVGPTQTPDNGGDGGSANVGIIIGIAAAVLIACAAIYFAWKWRTKQTNRSAQRRGENSKPRKS